MNVQINTDHNAPGTEAMSAQVTEIVEGALVHYRDRITRVEVHLSDENGAKAGTRDKRCLMEVRVEGRQPVTVSATSGKWDRAIRSAAGKLKRMIESDSGRTSAHHG